MSREKSISRTESNHPRVSEPKFLSCCPSVVEKTTRTGYPVAQGGTWKGFSVPLSPSITIVTHLNHNVKTFLSILFWVLQLHLEALLLQRTSGQVPQSVSLCLLPYRISEKVSQSLTQIIVCHIEVVLSSLFSQRLLRGISENKYTHKPWHTQDNTQGHKCQVKSSQRASEALRVAWYDSCRILALTESFSYGMGFAKGGWYKTCRGALGISVRKD